MDENERQQALALVRIKIEELAARTQKLPEDIETDELVGYLIEGGMGLPFSLVDSIRHHGLIFCSECSHTVGFTEECDICASARSGSFISISSHFSPSTKQE